MLKLCHGKLPHVNLRAVLNASKLLTDFCIEMDCEFFYETCEMGKETCKSQPTVKAPNNFKPDVSEKKLKFKKRLTGASIFQNSFKILQRIMV